MSYENKIIEFVKKCFPLYEDALAFTLLPLALILLVNSFDGSISWDNRFISFVLALVGAITYDYVQRRVFEGHNQIVRRHFLIIMTFIIISGFFFIFTVNNEMYSYLYQNTEVVLIFSVLGIYSLLFFPIVTIYLFLGTLKFVDRLD